MLFLLLVYHMNVATFAVVYCYDHSYWYWDDDLMHGKFCGKRCYAHQTH